MPKRLENALIIIVLLVLVLGGAYLAPNAPSHTYTYEPPDSQYELSAYCSMGNEDTEPAVHLP